jgi:pyridoxine 5-phosphate synthase
LSGARAVVTTKLSVNVNKVATLRNSRGGAQPSVLDAVRVCVAAGSPGITVHPRADERHIRRSDVLEIAALLRGAELGARGVELNIEGDPRPDWVELVREVRPTQATLVPVRPGEVTSEAGWPLDSDLRPIVSALRADGIRISVFVDAQPDAIEWAARMGADRIELYTEPFARAYASSAAEGARVFAQHVACAERAHALGLEINAGHDLDLENLTLYRGLPQLAEVSIGHAIMSRALFVGLPRVVGEYLAVLSG